MRSNHHLLGGGGGILYLDRLGRDCRGRRPVTYLMRCPMVGFDERGLGTPVSVDVPSIFSWFPGSVTAKEGTGPGSGK
jgi:hypothetical protein